MSDVLVLKQRPGRLLTALFSMSWIHRYAAYGLRKGKEPEKELLENAGRGTAPRLTRKRRKAALVFQAQTACRLHAAPKGFRSFNQEAGVTAKPGAATARGSLDDTLRALSDKAFKAGCSDSRIFHAKVIARHSARCGGRWRRCRQIQSHSGGARPRRHVHCMVIREWELARQCATVFAE